MNNLKEKMKKFDQRWNVEGDATPEENFSKFKIRVLNILDDIDNHVMDEDISLFCRFCGIPEKWDYSYLGDQKWSKNIINKLNFEDVQVEFFKLLEIIFSLEIKNSRYYDGSSAYSKEKIYEDLCEAISFSNINLTTTKVDNGEIIFYPKGEEKLDEDLVNNVLSFLDEKSNNHFVEALKLYSDKKWVKSAESLRRSLEEFLRVKLKNNAGLKANTLEISKRLKDTENPLQARNIIVNVFNYIDSFFNEESKHKDGNLEENEAEFLIYQISLLMRYINKQIK